MDALTLHRIHFAFTITYHYLFPQLTMGLALQIVVLKTMALRTNDERYNVAARFWARIFSVNFLLGVVTVIPMEFQFGTNWSEFSRRAGGVIGQPLAWKESFPSFWNLPSSASSCSAKSVSRSSLIGEQPFWYFLVRGSPASSSSSPMRGCSIRWRIGFCPTASTKSPASGASS
jgi:hypothetical protein